MDTGWIRSSGLGFGESGREFREQAGEPLQLLLAHVFRQVGFYLLQPPGGCLDPPTARLGRGYYPGPPVLYFWPRNEIMFVEGLEVRPAEYLKQVAHEFETWHWRSRMGFNAAAAVSAFVGFLRLYRHRLLSRGDIGGKA